MISTHRAALRRTIASTAGRSDSFSSSLGRNLLVRSTRLSIKANRVFSFATIGPTSSPHIKNKHRHQAQRSRPRACPVVHLVWQHRPADDDIISKDQQDAYQIAYRGGQPHHRL